MVYHERQTEVTPVVGRLARSVHYSHVRHEVAAEIEATEVNAVAIASYLIKDTRGNSLRGLARIVAGKHAIDVGIVPGPEAPPDFHR